MTTLDELGMLMAALRQAAEASFLPVKGILIGDGAVGADVQREARRQEEAVTALVLAGLSPSDAARVVSVAARAEQRLPTDAEIAEDANVTGSDADIENSRQAWWITLTSLTAWAEFTRLLDAAPLPVDERAS